MRVEWLAALADNRRRLPAPPILSGSEHPTWSSELSVTDFNSTFYQVLLLRLIKWKR